MKFLVTGASGFIGTHVIKELHARGNDFVILTHRHAHPTPDLQHLANETNWVQGDIADVAFVDKTVSDHRPDVIINIAALMNFGCAQNPRRAVEINVLGLSNLLEAARKYDVKRVVNASSGTVYSHGKGDLNERRAISTDVPIYGACKFFNEVLCRQYTENYGLETTNLRYFLVYGPGEAGSSIYAQEFKKIESIATGRTITAQYFPANGAQEFLFVADAAHATVLAATVPGPLSVAYNISGRPDDRVSMREVVALIKKLAPGSGDVIFKLESANNEALPPDISLAREQLGFEPRYSLEEGLRQCIDYLRQHADTSHQ